MIAKTIKWIESVKGREYVLIIMLFACTLPFKHNYSNWVMVLFGLYMGTALIRRKTEYAFDRKALSAIKFLPLLFVCFAVSLIYSTDVLKGLSFLGKFSYLVTFPLLFCFFSLTANDKRWILVSFVSGNFIAIVFNLGRALSRSLHHVDGHFTFDASVLGGQTFWYSIAQGGNYFFYDELSSVMHPTYWAIYLLLCVFIILDVLPRPISVIRFFIFGSILLIFLLAIFLCSSRIVLISTAALLFVFLVTIIVRKRSIYWLGAGAAMLLVLSILFLTNPRFGGVAGFNSLETLHSKRLEDWRSAFKVFESSPFVGVGIGDSQTMLMKVHLDRGYQEGFDKRYNEHNQYLQIANTTGLIGLGIFLLAFVQAFRTSINDRSYLQFAFVFSFALVCIVENFVERRSGAIYFVLFYSILFIPSKDATK